MLISFDERGNIYPYQKVELAIDSCFDAFVSNIPLSRTRGVLFDNLLRYRAELFQKANCSFLQWLNGSFVTQKLNPNDIDLANLIPYDDDIEQQIETLMPYFSLGGSLEKYQIDAHLIPVYPENDIRFENTKLRLAYFEKWFGHDRAYHSKGFIEIIEP